MISTNGQAEATIRSYIPPSNAAALGRGGGQRAGRKGGGGEGEKKSQKTGRAEEDEGKAG